jgi:hypothetical protein
MLSPVTFQRIGILVINAGKPDLLPTTSHRKTAIVEETATASLDQANQGDGLGGATPSTRLGGDECGEVVERGAGGAQHLGDAFSGGPALTAFTGDALRLVEGREVEAGAFGEAGRG